jgi:L,D-transpeptidase catalytic domain
LASARLFAAAASPSSPEPDMRKFLHPGFWSVLVILCGLTQAASAAAHKDHGRIWYDQSHLPVLALPDGQREVVRSVLDVAKPMHYGEFVWNDAGIPDGTVWVRVDLAHQMLSVFRDGHEIGSTVILYGAPTNVSPRGMFNVLDKDAAYISHKYRAPMPYMLRLTNDGVAIHGSDVREGWATHGCIGVPVAFAQHVFSVAHKGDLVAIL